MRKYASRIAAFLMILLGLVRGFGGMLLLGGSEDLDLGMPITASEGTLALAGYSLVVVCLLLVIAGIVLTIRHDRLSWMISWIGLGLFLVGGLMNGFLLFGSPQLSGQVVNLLVSGLIAGCLLWSKKALRK